MLRYELALSVTVLAVAALAESTLASLSAEQAVLVKKQLDANNLTMTFKVCGYYCGPGWCSDKYISETSCVADGIWGIAPEASEACTDGCCRLHDRCCGSGDRSGCNKMIISCLDNNHCESACSWAVWAAMKVVSHWCCGSSCPTYFDTHGGTRQMSLEGRSYCAKESGTKIEFTTTGAHVSVATSAGPALCTTASLPFSLNQTSNRIYIGAEATELRAIAGAAASPNAHAAASCARDRVLQTAAKLWFFPHTDEVFVRLPGAPTPVYETLQRCG